MSERFKETSDIDLIMMLNEVKKAGHPEDKEFIKELQLELRERCKVISEKGKWAKNLHPRT